MRAGQLHDLVDVTADDQLGGDAELGGRLADDPVASGADDVAQPLGSEPVAVQDLAVGRQDERGLVHIVEQRLEPRVLLPQPRPLGIIGPGGNGDRLFARSFQMLLFDLVDEVTLHQLALPELERQIDGRR